jgi:pimeloyl-ACP methyl ester carboxylesterase/uncharacterized protein YndB with AHSA1/START domain
MSTNLIARASTSIDASRERVWNALVDPEAIEQYMFGTHVVSDWREGSPIVWKGEWQGKPYEDKGVILQFEPQRTLQYSHFSPLSGVPDKPENYHTVTVELTGDRDRTNVSLVQDKNVTEEERAHSEQNWETMLATLKEFIERERAGKGQFADVNGLHMYYETHGAGDPLILLHGGFGVTSMFGPVLPALAENRQVIAVELQGHGHTADIDRPLSFEQMADDVAALIERLGMEHADVLGYSLGGGVALQTAIRHPNLVRKLVLVSAPFKSDGWYPEVLAGMSSMTAEMGETWVGSPMYQAYASVAPRPDDWPTLVGKMGQLLGQGYDWSAAIPAIQSPVMIVVGDADSVRTAHAVEFFDLLGGGQRDADWDRSGMSNARLAVLPGTTHYDIFSSPALAAAVIPFLDAPARAKPREPGD